MNSTTIPAPYITFKGNRYRVAKLLDNAGAAPLIETTIDTLHTDSLLVGGKPSVSLTHPVLAKYEGSYVVLLGQELVEQQKQEGVLFIRGRLLSNPVLKRCLFS